MRLVGEEPLICQLFVAGHLVVKAVFQFILLLFQWLRAPAVTGNYITAAAITGAVVVVIGLISVVYTKETFGKDLEFMEK